MRFRRFRDVEPCRLQQDFRLRRYFLAMLQRTGVVVGDAVDGQPAAGIFLVRSGIRKYHASAYLSH